MAVINTKAELRVIIASPQGVPVYETQSFLEVSIQKHLWQPGLATLKFNGNDSIRPYLQTNSQIIIQRRNRELGIEWYTEFTGLFRKQKREQPQDKKYFYATFPGDMTILSWVHVMWPDQIDGRSVFTQVPAETIMKTMVKYNIIPAYAVTNPADPGNGRAYSIPTPGFFDHITIQADLGLGPLLDTKAAWKNLLTALQDLAPVAGGDFNLVKTGPVSWEFRYYSGQLGTDRTSTVKFSANNGNMIAPSFTYDKTNEATLAIVGGRSDAQDRSYIAVQGNTYDPVNNYIETFVHATEQSTDQYMITKGKQYLYKAQARNVITFDPVQTTKTRYGADYFLGDIVTAEYEEISTQVKIVGINLTLSQDGKETIKADLRDPTVDDSIY